MTPEKYIRNAIKDSGMMFKAVSDKTGIKYSTLQMALAGKTKLKVPDYITLCSLFDIDPRGYQWEDNNAADK